jgi:hypothetical protein
MKRGRLALLGCVCVAGVLAGLAVRSASGMITFRKAFVETYIGDAKSPQQQALAKAVDTAKCNVCHDAAPGKAKKDHNPYGQSLKKLGLKKTEKDTTKIAKFLKEAESQKNGAGGTFGDRLKEGKLPYEDK